MLEEVYNFRRQPKLGLKLAAQEAMKARNPTVSKKDKKGEAA